MNEVTLAVIGGSGLGEALLDQADADATPIEHNIKTPFGPTSGPITESRWAGRRVLLLQRHGPGHIHPPAGVPYQANIFALKKLGATHVVASGATGSLREDFQPGQVVIVDQVIDKTTQRPVTFYEKAAVHVEFAEPFCPVMRRWLLKAGEELKDAAIHDGGTYVCMEGPAFSTKAESHMHRSWGGDLIGMTAMPEAKLAREAELAYALIGLPTDYDCWKPHDSEQDQMSLLHEIIGNLKLASSRGLELIKIALGDLDSLAAEPSPAHDALKFGIWTQKDAIDLEEVDRLRPLWGRYFEAK